MGSRPGSAIPLLLLTLLVSVAGLKLTLEKTPGGTYCGKLQCLGDDSNLPDIVLSMIGMSIYDVTHQNIPLKLASISAFTPGVVVEPSKLSDINATGSIAKNQAILALSLRRTDDCQYGYFQCELDFVNTNGQSDVIREYLSPADDNVTIMNILSQMSEQLKTQTESLSKVLQGFSKIEKSLETACVAKDGPSASTPSTEVVVTSCYRGMPSSQPRVKLNLWNKTVVLCDTQADGGGWVVIQRRKKGDVNFFRSWNDYKKGFGTADTDYWIGNDIIHDLTSQGYNELRVDLEKDGETSYGQWSYFNVSDEDSNYHLSINGISGTIYDNLLENNDRYFQTYDRIDNNYCAKNNHGGWWFSSCGTSNLNGVWGAEDRTAIAWGDDKKFTSVEMKVRHS